MARGNPLVMKHSLRHQWFLGVVASLIMFAALGVGKAFGQITKSTTHEKFIAWGCALVILFAGIFAIRHLASALGRSLARQSSLGAGATLRLVASGVGYLILLFTLFGVLDVSASHLLIGFGLTSVIIGIAAQQSLGNIFASIVLLFARPFVVGDEIHIHSGALGMLDVKVLGIGMTYVTVRSDNEIMKIPNSAMLAAGIGRSAPKVPGLTSPDDPPEL